MRRGGRTSGVSLKGTVVVTKLRSTGSHTAHDPLVQRDEGRERGRLRKATKHRARLFALSDGVAYCFLRGGADSE